MIRSLKCHSGSVSVCCFDSNSRQLLTCCESEGSTYFWNVSQLLTKVLHSSKSSPTTTLTLPQHSAPLEDSQVLTECSSPTEDCGPIPSSFSPSAAHKRYAVSQKEDVPTAASMPVWGATNTRQPSIQCEERVRRAAAVVDDPEGISAPLPLLGAHGGAMFALRTSVCRQELQRKRAQEHASWLRNQFDDLDAMQHELQVCTTMCSFLWCISSPLSLQQMLCIQLQS